MTELAFYGIDAIHLKQHGEVLPGRLIVIEGTAPAAPLAGEQWLRGGGYGDDALRTGGRWPEAGQRGTYARPDHSQSLLRDRFCRPLREPDFAGPARRIYRADRPLYLFIDGAGDCARRRPALDSLHLRPRAHSRRDFLSENWPGRFDPACLAARRLRLLGVGHGYAAGRRPLRELRELSDAPARTI